MKTDDCISYHVSDSDVHRAVELGIRLELRNMGLNPYDYNQDFIRNLSISISERIHEEIHNLPPSC